MRVTKAHARSRSRTAAAAVARPRHAEVPRSYHAVFAFWIGAMLLCAYFAPARYEALLQEDNAVEWATVWLFLVAAIFHARQALGDRRIFDAAVALFCLFVAGEEFSWGQRLLGYDAPDYFLANNFQQEINLHNLTGSFLKPKWVFIIALAGYGIALPLLSRSLRWQRVSARLGATAPPLQLAPWFAAAVLMLLWYPFTLTGEWVELLAGILFVAAKESKAKTLWAVLASTLVFGVLMTGVTNAFEGSRSVARSECAKAEAQSLSEDLIRGGAATAKFRELRAIHKRVWTAMNEGYIERERLRAFNTARCAGDEETKGRRLYAVDPWGTSYWVHFSRLDNGQRRLAVYSFGPNRRRDGMDGAPGGDDITIESVLSR